MEEKGHFINALPDSGLVTLLAVVRERELRPRRSGGVYLHLLLGDRTGEIAGRVWDGAEETARLFEADDVVKVRGTLERYNGKSQLIVQRIRRCQEEEFDESDFSPVSDLHPDEMLSHHGEVEKGALREPMLAEAVVLHALDELDARLEQVWRLVDLAPAGEEWTAYVPSLRRQIYCASTNTAAAHQEDGREGMA